MSRTFKKTTLFEIIFLTLGAIIASLGKHQSQHFLLGLGVVLMGVGILVGAVNVIKQREISFFYTNGRFFSHGYTGASAISWGIMLLLAAGAAVFVGLGIGLGMMEQVKSLVLEPGLWIIVAGLVFCFSTFAWTFQDSKDEASGLWLQAIIRPLRYILGVSFIFLSLVITGVGVWGLQEPLELRQAGERIKEVVQHWVDDRS